MTTETPTKTFAIESIELRDLRALDLRREAVQLQWSTPDETITKADVDELIWDLSTQEPFRQHSALAYRVTIHGEASTADVLVDTTDDRIGIAWGADATWGDLWSECDLTTEAGGDEFAAAVRAAVNDWLNDHEAWDARY